MADLIFAAQFVTAQVGKTGLTVTVDVDRYTISDGSRTALVTGGAATEGRRGLYSYRLASADLALYQYIATFITANATVDQQEIPALGLVMPDALVSSRLAPTTAGRTLDVSATGEGGIDWANVGSPTTTVGLSGTTVKTATDIASLIGAAGAGLTALATQASVNDVPTNSELATALAGADDAVLAAIAALNDLSAADVLAAAYEGSETLQAFLRLARAVLVGRSSGGGAVYRDAADSKARVTATLDAIGNRTAVSTDAT